MEEISQRKAEYNEYLRSPEWIDRRNTFRGTHKNQCYLCGGNQNLHVHHLTYARVGHEEPDDLLLLCRECHNKFHALEHGAVKEIFREVSETIRASSEYKSLRQKYRGAMAMALAKYMVQNFGTTIRKDQITRIANALIIQDSAQLTGAISLIPSVSNDAAHIYAKIRKETDYDK